MLKLRAFYIVMFLHCLPNIIWAMAPESYEEGWRWRSSLNFKYRNQCFEEIDDFHMQLALKEEQIFNIMGKQKNIVICAFSFIIENKDNKILKWHNKFDNSLFIPSMTDNQSKTTRVLQVVFRSGTDPINDKIEKQIKNLGYQIIPLAHPKLSYSDLKSKIENLIEEDIKDTDKLTERLEKIITEKNLTDYIEEITEKLGEKIRNFPFKYSPHRINKKLIEEIKKLLGEELRSPKNVDIKSQSFAHSEQNAFHYLHTHFDMSVMQYLKPFLDNMAQKNSQNIKAIILHLHSSRPTCKYCSPFINLELGYNTATNPMKNATPNKYFLGNFVKNKIAQENDPIFTILVSCRNEAVKSEHSREEAQGPILNKKLNYKREEVGNDEEFNNTIQLETLVHSGLFIQKRISMNNLTYKAAKNVVRAHTEIINQNIDLFKQNRQEEIVRENNLLSTYDKALLVMENNGLKKFLINHYYKEEIKSQSIIEKLLSIKKVDECLENNSIINLENILTDIISTSDPEHKYLTPKILSEELFSRRATPQTEEEEWDLGTLD